MTEKERKQGGSSSERDIFCKELVKELRKKTDVSSENRSTSEIVRALAYDWPVLNDSEASALSTALKKDKFRQRLSYRSIRGARLVAERRDATSGHAKLVAALGGFALRALLEMPRSQAIRFASKVFDGTDDIGQISQSLDQTTTEIIHTEIKQVKEKAGIDYSKWDTFDTDDSDNDVPIKSHIDIPNLQVWATVVCDNAKDVAAFTIELAKCTEYSLLATLPQNDWPEFLHEIFTIAGLLRGDTRSSGWVLEKCADILLPIYEKCIFLLRDALTSCQHKKAREVAGTLLSDLALEAPGSGVRSAKDGGLALLAIASTAQLEKKDSRDTCIRTTARRALPAANEMIRALAHARGQSTGHDEPLLGASIALVEIATGIACSAGEAGGLFTSVDRLAGIGQQLIDTGILAALCALAPRLAAEARDQTTTRANEAQQRLHRLLIATSAQDPKTSGAFILRASVLLDIIYADDFVLKCPMEAALWAARLSVLTYVPNDLDRTKRKNKSSKDPRLARLSTAVFDATHALSDPKQRLSVLDLVLQLATHLNLTRDATAAWLSEDCRANSFFLNMRKYLLTTEKRSASIADSSQNISDQEKPPEDQDVYKIKGRQLAESRLLARLRRELKLLPIAAAEHSSADTNGQTHDNQPVSSIAIGPAKVD